MYIHVIDIWNSRHHGQVFLNSVKDYLKCACKSRNLKCIIMNTNDHTQDFTPKSSLLHWNSSNHDMLVVRGPDQDHVFSAMCPVDHGYIKAHVRLSEQVVSMTIHLCSVSYHWERERKILSFTSASSIYIWY